MRLVFKVFFLGLMFFTLFFSSGLTGESGSEPNQLKERGRKRDFVREMREREKLNYRGTEIPVYNRSGAPLSPEQGKTILAMVDFLVSANDGTAAQWSPAIAIDGSGNFVITWGDERNGNPDIYAQRYNSAGTPQGSNFKVNTDAGTAEQYEPTIAMDGSGNFIIIWKDYRSGNEDIYAQGYYSSGTPQGSNFKVNDDFGTADQWSPAIAIDGSGNFVITWGDERNGNTDIYAQRYNSTGTPQGSNFKVNTDAGTADQRGPGIAIDGSGSFVITWEDYRNGNMDIYAQRYNSTGTPQGSNFKVNDDAGTTYQWSPAIALDGSGNFIIIWQDNRSGNYDIYAQRYNSVGTPQGSNFIVNTDAGTANQWSPAIAMDGSGNFVITWEDLRNGNYDIYAQRCNSSGTLLGSNFKVNTDVGTADQFAPAIAMDGSGNFVITWEDYRNGNPDIYAQRYNSAGTPQGSYFQVNTDAGTADQGGTAIAMDGSGNFVITWIDERNVDSDIYAQLYNSAGTPQGSNFKVNTDAGTTDQWGPAIAIDGSGNFVITWEDLRNGNFDIYAQQYNSAGTPQGFNFKVNSDAGTTYQYASAIAMDGSGNFFIIWQDYRNGNMDIYAQRYNSAGSPQGTNFKVPADAGTAAQEYPAIAMDGSGNFVITWEDSRNGNMDIYAQRYNSAGSPQSSNFKVNTDAGTAGQQFSAIAMDDSGSFVITWHDYRNGDEDIYAQRYNSSGSPLGENYLVPDPLYAGYPQQMPSVGLSGSILCFTWQDLRNGNWDIYAKVWRSFNPFLNTFTGYSPIDLVIIDPVGDSIGIGFNTISNATYDTTTDVNGDGDKDDVISIPDPLVGEFKIRIIAEPGADTGHYSLGVKLGENRESMLMKNVEIPAPGEADSISYEVSAYLRGDANRDGKKSVSDVVFLINYLFKGGPAPDPVDLGDANFCNTNPPVLPGEPTVADVVYLVNYLFKGGVAPCS